MPIPDGIFINWYFGFQIGGGSASFDGSKAATAASLDASSLFSPLTIASKLEFLWPVGNKTLLGVASGGAAKVYSHPTDIRQSQTFSQSMLTLEMLHTFGDEPGSGIYLNLGAGLGLAYQTVGSSFLSFSNSETGLGLRAGAGFGLAVSDDTRLLFGLEHGMISGVGSTNYYAISVGPLF